MSLRKINPNERTVMPTTRLTRTALWFHPAKIKDSWEPKVPICDGEPTLIPAGQKVIVEMEYNGRIFLRLYRGQVPGWVWASLRDLTPEKDA